MLTEREAARDYYESGAVRYEHLTERQITWVDPRVSQAKGSWFADWFERVVIWLYQWTIVSASVGVAAIVGWAGWTLGHMTGAVVMLLLLSAIYRRLAKDL